jgi:hypothetical protein
MALSRKQREAGLDPAMNGSPAAVMLPHPPLGGQRQQRCQGAEHLPYLQSATSRKKASDSDGQYGDA